jgi:hypothetical protein
MPAQVLRGKEVTLQTSQENFARSVIHRSMEIVFERGGPIEGGSELACTDHKEDLYDLEEDWRYRREFGWCSFDFR